MLLSFTSIKAIRVIKNQLFLTSVIFTVPFLLALNGCPNAQMNSNPNDKGKIETTFEIGYPISLKTRQFLLDFQKELNEQGKSIDIFIPSQKLIQEYHILFHNASYYVSGFITLTDSFEIEKLEEIGVSVGQQSGIILVVIIPQKALSKFLVIEGISYFEISEKANIN